MEVSRERKQKRTKGGDLVKEMIKVTLFGEMISADMTEMMRPLWIVRVDPPYHRKYPHGREVGGVGGGEQMLREGTRGAEMGGGRWPRNTKGCWPPLEANGRHTAPWTPSSRTCVPAPRTVSEHPSAVVICHRSLRRAATLIMV